MKTTMIRKFAILFSIILGSVAYGQVKTDPVLMKIAGEPVLKSEFLNIYQKNNVKGEVIDKKSLEEYLELYINFKLKVKEAEEQGLDTVTAFKTELAGYRKQLAQPYLIDNDVNESLLKEAYDRSKEDVRASHILIRMNADASPKDTLAAWDKIMQIRKRILAGEDFGKVAQETSEDPSAKDREANEMHPFIKGNAGDLGYFTVFDMVYPFETAGFNTSVGQVSMPIRTDFGYHLVKVTDKKPAMGKVQVAHIFVQMPKNATHEDSLKAKAKINEAYEKLKGNIEFGDVAKQYSDDKGTASKGGVLPWFGVNRMVPEFIIAVASLKNKGDISQPIQTSYGWHIIKLLDKKEPGTFDDTKTDLKQKLAKDTRSQKSKDSMLKKIQAEYNFKEDPKTREKFYELVDSTIFAAKWDANKARKLKKVMFSIGDKKVTQADFAGYLDSKQRNRTKENIENYVNNAYKEFIDETCMNYADSHLEGKFPDFKSLMKEYRDGILLFELTDQKVWTKAVKDSTGLEEFYKKNGNYMWDERLDASIYKCKNTEVALEAHKLAEEAELKGYSEKDLLAKINKDSIPNLSIEDGKFSKGDNPVIDKVKWEKGISDLINQDDKVLFVVVRQKLAPEPKTLNEARGLVTADYQNYLEKEWIKTLRNKYPVEVNQEVFNSIK